MQQTAVQVFKPNAIVEILRTLPTAVAAHGLPINDKTKKILPFASVP